MTFDEFLKVDIPFKMTHEQVLVAATQIEEKRELLREAMTELRHKGEALERRCKHPNEFDKYHYDGSTSTKCPDCGKSVG